MPQSATPTTLTERMAATSSRLTAVSRRLTAQHGLAGFTIEDVCAEVGVSRRTFFNYFPSKEEAVLGLDESELTERLAAEFLARGARGWAAVIDDLAELAIAHADGAGLDFAAHSEFIRAVSREPKLLARFIDMTRERELQLIELVAAREGTTTDDLHARAVVLVVATALRMTGGRILDPDVDVDFATALTESIAAIRGVLTAPSTTEGSR